MLFTVYIFFIFLDSKLLSSVHYNSIQQIVYIKNFKEHESQRNYINLFHRTYFKNIFVAFP